MPEREAEATSDKTSLAAQPKSRMTAKHGLGLEPRAQQFSPLPTS